MNIIKSFFSIATACSFGAYAAGTLVPAGSGLQPAEIISHDVVVTINNGFAQTEVTQQFKNVNSQVVECVYSFPVPQSASMSECHVLVGEVPMEGEVVARDKAQQIYKDEQNAGNKVAVADKDGYQDFTFRIANIGPDEIANITFTYYQPLKIDSNVGQYVYPLEEGNTKDDAALSFWTRNSAPTGKTNIRVKLRSAWPIAGIRAPYGNAVTNKEDLANGEADMEYELPDGLNRDFVFYYNLESGIPGRLEIVPYKKAGEDGTFMMVLTPGEDIKPIQNGADYIFVLDCSGSMYGGKIQKLADGVAQTIRTINSNDRFRIITFSTDASDITNGYLPATEGNVETTCQKLKNLASGGSTNMYAGLKMALSKLDADRVTSIVLVTDGVTNTGEVSPAAFAKLMKKQDIRVFGFLMGNQANWPLMRTICDVSGGFYDSVSNNDDIIGKILLAKSKIVNEAMHDVNVSISGVNTYDVTKQCVKKLYLGQQLVMLGHYKDGGKATVTMKTKISGEDKAYNCNVIFPDVDEDNPELERIWALAQVEMHEDMVNQGIESNSEHQDFLRNIGVEYQIVTDETSLIMLTDEGHSKHGIERRNLSRVQNEKRAQSARNAAPIKNYRADVPGASDTGVQTTMNPEVANTTENTYQPTHGAHHNNMFTMPSFDIGHCGGGALDVWSLMIIGSFAAIAVLGKKKTR